MKWWLTDGVSQTVSPSVETLPEIDKRPLLRRHRTRSFAETPERLSVETLAGPAPSDEGAKRRSLCVLSLFLSLSLPPPPICMVLGNMSKRTLAECRKRRASGRAPSALRGERRAVAALDFSELEESKSERTLGT